MKPIKAYRWLLDVAQRAKLTEWIKLMPTASSSANPGGVGDFDMVCDFDANCKLEVAQVSLVASGGDQPVLSSTLASRKREAKEKSCGVDKKRMIDKWFECDD